MTKVIETERLVLRRLAMSDHRAFVSLLTDPLVMRFSDEGPLSAEAVITWLNCQTEGDDHDSDLALRAIEIKGTAEVIGYCGLIAMRDLDGACETAMGYRLVRHCWGRGYATEAASAIRDYAFSKLQLPRLVALIDPDNKPSIGVAKKIGMYCEKAIMLDGYDHPDFLYVIHNPK